MPVPAEADEATPAVAPEPYPEQSAPGSPRAGADLGLAVGRASTAPAPDEPASGPPPGQPPHDSPPPEAPPSGRPAASQASPDGVVERMANGLARAADGLQVAVSERVAEVLGRVSGLVAGVSGRVSDLAGWAGEVADGVVSGIAEVAGRILGGGSQDPADGPLVPARTPAVPPPAPTPVGSFSYSGGSASGGPTFSPDDHDGPGQHQFGVLDPLSFAIWQGGGRTWPSREPLTPSSLARPPNNRPG